MTTKALVWYRLDLRLQDNPALAAAMQAHEVIPVFVYSPEEDGAAAPGAASRWWLHRSLQKLSVDIKERGGSLVIRKGPALPAIKALLRETGAQAVYWNRRYEPTLLERDKDVKTVLKSAGVEVKSFNSALMFEPWDVATANSDPYTVFTPFWRKCMSSPPAPPARKMSAWNLHQETPTSLPLESLELLPKLGWANTWDQIFTPGEEGARAALTRFVSGKLDGYGEGRDLPAHGQVSRLSPHLHFGEISPNRVFHAAIAAREKGQVNTEDAEHFQRELGWREFSHHLLYHFPHTTTSPLNQAFSRFEWAKDKAALKAWQRGQTGYPIVDAGMRELWSTGFMHNRVRMIVASFLVKHLLLPWQEGAAWFWDTLVDADLANNTLGWQWTAGCGADAAPFFRIFNPVLQAQKFDDEGTYIRSWVPELAKAPTKFIGRPWEAPSGSLEALGIRLGKTYPRPIVDHSYARARALEAFARTKLSKPKAQVS